MNKPKKCFLFHSWSEWITHTLHLYNQKNKLRFKITIYEKVCLKCNKLKAKLKK